MTEKKQIEELKKRLDDKCIDLELWNEPDRRVLAELVVREFGYRKQTDRYYIEPGKPPVLIETSENRKRTEGEWIQQPRPYEDEIVCSVCGANFNILDNCTEKFDYCPNCGAKMKGDKE